MQNMYFSINLDVQIRKGAHTEFHMTNIKCSFSDHYRVETFFMRGFILLNYLAN